MLGFDLMGRELIRSKCRGVPGRARESATSRHPASFPSILTVWGPTSFAVMNDTVPYRAEIHASILLSYFTSTVMMTNALFSWLP